METETAAREDLATLSREELTRKYMSAMQEKEELANRLRTAAIEKDEMASQINWLCEQLNVLRTRKFSKNSEQVSSLQISLFNEAEDTLDHALPEDLSEDKITKAVPVKKHKNRKISAGSLPVKEIHHELTNRSGMKELKPEKKDYLRYVKGYYYIERHIIHQYVKKDDANDEHTEVYSNTEGLPARLIEGSSVTSSVVAQIANEKYNLATPLYRMEQDCMRNGIPISRQNMSNWLIRCGEDYLGTVFDRMHSDLITDAKIIHMDETTKVVIEDKADGREKSYIWAMTGKYEPSQMILYFYYESREHRHVEDILGHDYTGYLNSDGFGGYHSYPGAVCCGCWAHYRRKAYEAMISDDNIYSAYNKLHSADERRTFLDGHPSFKIKVALLEKIDQIMKLEPKEEKTSAEEIYQIRQEKALPLIEALFTWTRELEASIPPKSKLGEPSDMAIMKNNTFGITFLTGTSR